MEPIKRQMLSKRADGTRVRIVVVAYPERWGRGWLYTQPRHYVNRWYQGRWRPMKEEEVSRLEKRAVKAFEESVMLESEMCLAQAEESEAIPRITANDDRRAPVVDIRALANAKAMR